jgi:YbgC/YbaW family acyl-CoA thioester hydrolase
MMSVRVRLAMMLTRWAVKERHQEPQTVSRLAMRCWLTDLDINQHMNNSRYLALMDLGRYHFMMVSGLGKELMVRQRWRPVLVRAEVDFKKSLQPGDRFVLETQLERLGTKSSVLVQRFWKGDQLVAEGRATAVFLKGGRSQDMSALMNEWGHLLPDEPLDRQGSVERIGEPSLTTDQLDPNLGV